MKDVFERFLRFLYRARLSAVATLLLSSVVSVLDKRLTLARWDGEDWEFKWRGGCLYWHSHRLRPRVTTLKHLGSYLSFYCPKPGDTILDLGAGAGTEVCSLSNMVGSAGRVIAVEADPSAARRLRKQAKGLRYSNVTVREVAVGDQDGVVELYVAEPGGVANSIAAAVGLTSLSVPCTTLRSILIESNVESVAYMKMNIEGAEYLALRGLGSSIGDIREIFVSCHDFTGVEEQRTYNLVFDYLSGLGFQIRTLPRNPEARWEEFYIFANRELSPKVAG